MNRLPYPLLFALAALASVVGCNSTPKPETGDEKVPKGTMYVGLSDAAGTTSVHKHFLGDRQRVRTFAVHMALDLLRRRITGLL